jgi:ribosome biogenesis GTPase
MLVSKLQTLNFKLQTIFYCSMTGLVYKSTGSWYTVKSEQGDFIECRMKGKFGLKASKVPTPLL